MGFLTSLYSRPFVNRNAVAGKCLVLAGGLSLMSSTNAADTIPLQVNGNLTITGMATVHAAHQSSWSVDEAQPEAAQCPGVQHGGTARSRKQLAVLLETGVIIKAMAVS